MSKKRIYLDNHATTKVRSEILEAMLPYFTEKFGNAASSTHQFGWEAKNGVEEARKNVADLIHTSPDSIVFTSGATESNNLVIKGICDSSDKKIHIISSVIEHDCVLEALKSRNKSCEYTLLPVNSEGIVEIEDLKKAIKPNTVLISIMFANNEIGSIQPIVEIGKLCKEQNIIFHTDAAQALGKIYINVDDYNIDLLSASAHKFGGPKGIGFLYINRKNKNKSLFLTILGFFFMGGASLITLFENSNIYLKLSLVLLEPGGWFMVWIGLDNLFFPPSGKKQEEEFYHKMSGCEITFHGY